MSSPPRGKPTVPRPSSSRESSPDPPPSKTPDRPETPLSRAESPFQARADDPTSDDETDEDALKPKPQPKPEPASAPTGGYSEDEGKGKGKGEAVDKPRQPPVTTRGRPVSPLSSHGSGSDSNESYRDDVPALKRAPNAEGRKPPPPPPTNASNQPRPQPSPEIPGGFVSSDDEADDKAHHNASKSSHRREAEESRGSSPVSEHAPVPEIVKPPTPVASFTPPPQPLKGILRDKKMEEEMERDQNARFERRFEDRERSRRANLDFCRARERALEARLELVREDNQSGRSSRAQKSLEKQLEEDLRRERKIRETIEREMAGELKVGPDGRQQVTGEDRRERQHHSQRDPRPDDRRPRAPEPLSRRDVREPEPPRRAPDSRREPVMRVSPTHGRDLSGRSVRQEAGDPRRESYVSEKPPPPRQHGGPPRVEEVRSSSRQRRNSDPPRKSSNSTASQLGEDFIWIEGVKYVVRDRSPKSRDESREPARPAHGNLDRRRSFDSGWDSRPSTPGSHAGSSHHHSPSSSRHQSPHSVHGSRRSPREEDEEEEARIKAMRERLFQLREQERRMQIQEEEMLHEREHRSRIPVRERDRDRDRDRAREQSRIRAEEEENRRREAARRERERWEAEVAREGRRREPEPWQDTGRRREHSSRRRSVSGRASVEPPIDPAPPPAKLKSSSGRPQRVGSFSSRVTEILSAPSRLRETKSTRHLSMPTQTSKSKRTSWQAEQDQSYQLPSYQQPPAPPPQSTVFEPQHHAVPRVVPQVIPHIVPHSAPHAAPRVVLAEPTQHRAFAHPMPPSQIPRPPVRNYGPVIAPERAPPIFARQGIPTHVAMGMGMGMHAEPAHVSPFPSFDPNGVPVEFFTPQPPPPPPPVTYSQAVPFEVQESRSFNLHDVTFSAI